MEKKVSDFDDNVWANIKIDRKENKKEIKRVEHVEESMFTQAVEEIVELVNTMSKTIGRLALAVLLINLVIITWRMM